MTLLDPVCPCKTGSCRVVALELLRPTVTLDRFITFTALAGHEHPQCGSGWRNGSDSEIVPCA